MRVKNERGETERIKKDGTRERQINLREEGEIYLRINSGGKRRGEKNREKKENWNHKLLSISVYYSCT